MRGECDLHILVDRQRKRYINAVDVVVRLHDPTDPSTETMAPPSFSTRSARWRSPDAGPAKWRGRVPSARRGGDDLDVLTTQGFA